MADEILKKWRNFVLNTFFDEKQDHTNQIKKSLIKMQKFKKLNPLFDLNDDKSGFSLN